jgi:MoxR-like ATPase
MTTDTESAADLGYTPLFNPGQQHIPQPARTDQRDERSQDAADRRRRPPYVYNEKLVLAVNVALATRRPLLVRGESGAGKSSLAANVADFLGRRYYEYVVTSRTEAAHLLWEVDLLRRLHDAQRKKGKLSRDYTPYIEPGPLWWAFDPNSAACRGGSERVLEDPAGKTMDARAVVLLDEIDKADPDVPNNLLVPLGSLQFQVKETGTRVSTSSDQAPLVIITSNEERELPPAFLRRCVEVKVDLPSRQRLEEIAATHFDDIAARAQALLETLLGPPPDDPDAPAGISPAEFIDALRACVELEVEPGTPAWDRVMDITVWKHGRQAPAHK